VNVCERAREVIRIEIEGLEGPVAQIGPGFESAVGRILDRLRAGGKIVVTGVGKNLHVAEKVSATLASTGATSVVLNPGQAVHGDLGIVNPGDILLVFSYTGESEEILALLPPLRRLAVEIVAVTGCPESALAGYSDVVIPVTVAREACPFNMAPTASTTAALALGDALAMVLLEARGFRKEDFAQLHPGGAIGRTLLYRVSDIMRREERLAAVPDDASVKDAVLAMTRARSGSAGIVDSAGRLCGIFTDGDLRRRLTEDAGLLERSVRDVMTSSPVTVHSDRLAVDVLRLFEEHKIDDLLVVDADGKLVGAVDSQDLPRLKIL